MKLSALVLSILALTPSVAFAQAAAPPPPHHMHGDMQQHMKQFEALRLQVLHALTPAHRELLASVVGQMATADKPDFKAAAAKLDAALSSGEKAAILDAHAKMVAQMKADHQAMMTAWQSAHPDATPQAMHPRDDMHASHTPDAGMILLMLAGHHGPGPRR